MIYLTHTSIQEKGTKREEDGVMLFPEFCTMPMRAKNSLSNIECILMVGLYALCGNCLEIL